MRTCWTCWLVGLCSLLAFVLPVPADEPRQDTSFGDRLRDTYFRLQTRKIADAALADINTLADWKKRRPKLRRQFLEMMGLWPMPKRTPLRAKITGKIDNEHFTVEKLHFQSIPGLYVSANLYVPKKAKIPAPAILYVCGHARTVKDGVSYGNKVNYQHHPAWFARHGYVCLIVDTLQLGEIQGLHHGTHHLNMWWWHTLGYTPAGIECWNGIRALDYLQSRKEVDPKRLGVTGRSGGGATSWWVAAADERPQCIIPVAGIADLWAHVVEGDVPRFRDGVISGHCDCMYMVNTYRWDFTQVMALCAPRALMLGNSDADSIFPVAGYRRMAGKVRRLYGLHGAREKFALLETKGPHKDTPELRKGAFDWMNRWLKGETGAVTEPEYQRFTPEQLQVFKTKPKDAINAIVHEKFIRPSRPELPGESEKIAAWWKKTSSRWKKALKEKVFRGWPEKPAPLQARQASDITQGGVRLRAYNFFSEKGVPLRLWVLTAADVKRPVRTLVVALDEAGWQEHIRVLGPAFKKALYSQLSLSPHPGSDFRSGGGNPPPHPYPAQDSKAFTQLRKTLRDKQQALVLLAPRGVGPTRWSKKSPATGRPAGQHILRKFVLLGQTLDGQRVWDVRRGLACLSTVPDLKKTSLTLSGKGVMAGIVLYASLFEPNVGQLRLTKLPVSHHDGPIFLNVRRLFDIPQALALAFPRQVTLVMSSADNKKAWNWAVRLQKRLGKEYITFVAPGS